MKSGIDAGKLVPACGGQEQPFTVNGRRWLYCWHPRSNRHCYLDVDHDRVVWNRSFHPAFAPELEDVIEPPRPQPARHRRSASAGIKAIPNYRW